MIEDGLSRAAIRATVSCAIQPELIVTSDLVKIERLIADRGRIYTPIRRETLSSGKRLYRERLHGGVQDRT